MSFLMHMRRRNPSTCTQAEGPRAILFIWAIASLSFSQNISRKYSMLFQSFRLQMTKNTYIDRSLSLMVKRARYRWVLQTSKTSSHLDSIQRRLLSFQMLSTSSTYTQTLSEFKNTSTTIKSKEFSVSMNQTMLESSLSLLSKQLQLSQTHSLTSLESERTYLA